MTRRDQIHKWAIYALAVLPIWLLDGLILNRYPVMGVRPMLLPLVVAAVATLEGPFAGSAFGLGIGLWWHGAYAGDHSAMILGMTLAGLGVGVVAQYALSQSFFGFLLCAGGLMAALEGWQMAAALFLQTAQLQQLMAVAVPEFLWTMAFTPLVYPVFRLVFRRVGGTRLA